MAGLHRAAADPAAWRWCAGRVAMAAQGMLPHSRDLLMQRVWTHGYSWTEEVHCTGPRDAGMMSRDGRAGDHSVHAAVSGSSALVGLQPQPKCRCSCRMTACVCEI